MKGQEINIKLMFLTISLLMLSILISGCDTSEAKGPQQVKYSMPKNLEDCEVYKIDAANNPYLYVVRCPNSTTSTTYEYREGKTTKYRSTVVIDGVKYESKEETAPVPVASVMIDGVEYVKVKNGK